MRLLESQAQRQPRRGGATLSVVAHAAIVAGAVVASATPGRSTVAPQPGPGIIWIAPPPEPPARRTGPTTPATGGAGGESAPTPPAGPGAPAFPVLGEIPTGIPPVGVGSVIDEWRLGLGGGHGDGTRAGAGGAGSDGVWSANVVEVPAAPLTGNPVPGYPEPLRVAGIAGRVLAEFVVDTTGRVRPGSLVIVESGHELFTIAVRRTVPALRFAPARAEGRQVAQRVRMPFEFEVR